jgi:tRNA-splicing ligase RtcB (3'-phosphate/5'-hydroxy nucleic acid ligase)
MISQVLTEGKFPVKIWTDNVEESALQQLKNISELPFIHKHIAVMPDVHYGIGATVGSVIATKKAIIPAAVGVDIGCGMIAVETTLTANDLPDSLKEIRDDLERAIPHGFVSIQGRSTKGNFDVVTSYNHNKWSSLSDDFKLITDKHKTIESFANPQKQLGTLGGGNHFVEICLDLDNRVWVMLHSGSRGVGNLIGRYFIDLAKKDMRTHHINLKNEDLAYLSEGTQHFDDYIFALNWAQRYASINRESMMESVLRVLRNHLKPFQLSNKAINCHHNYATIENHYGENVWITRKGAVRAREGDLGIVPGSMGAKSFIVRGKGNKESFCSCSHGAGRKMSRNEAKKFFTIEDLKEQTKNVECRKDDGVLDEIPSAYKDIDEVMDNQKDLVEVVAQLKQILCIKG